MWDVKRRSPFAPLPPQRLVGRSYSLVRCATSCCPGSVTYEFCVRAGGGTPRGVDEVRMVEPPMPQTATIKRLPAAFRMMKSMQAECVEWGEDYRQGARDAVAALLRGRTDQLIDEHLERMAELGQADRRNGCYRRHRAGRHRAGCAAHPDLQRAQGVAGLCTARQGRRPHDPRLLFARPLDPQGGDRPVARPGPAGQSCHRERPWLGSWMPPSPRSTAGRSRTPTACWSWTGGAQAQDRRRRAGPARAGRARAAPRRQGDDDVGPVGVGMGEQASLDDRMGDQHRESR